MAVIGSLLHKSAGYQKNAENMRTMLQLCRARGEAVMRGGGSQATEKLHQKGKLTARERIERLIDPGNLVQANSTTPLVVVTQEIFPCVSIALQ